MFGVMGLWGLEGRWGKEYVTPNGVLRGGGIDCPRVKTRGYQLTHILAQTATGCLPPLKGLKAPLPFIPSPQERGRSVTVGVLLRAYLKVIKSYALTNCA